jgi:hypothetical protein
MGRDRSHQLDLCHSIMPIMPIMPIMSIMPSARLLSRWRLGGRDGHELQRPDRRRTTAAVFCW